MATLRYIAYLAEDPARLVDFYHRFLGTEELGRTADGDITITDGFYNLTFFKNRPELGEMQTNNGLHHIGVQVDDLEEVKGRFIRMFPRGMIIPEANAAQFRHGRLHGVGQKADMIDAVFRFMAFDLAVERMDRQIGCTVAAKTVAATLLAAQKICSRFKGSKFKVTVVGWVQHSDTHPHWKMVVRR